MNKYLGSEVEFKALIQSMVDNGVYPAHREVVTRLGRPAGSFPFGLSTAQGRWRREVVEAAGFDWNSSRSARRLVRC